MSEQGEGHTSALQDLAHLGSFNLSSIDKYLSLLNSGIWRWSFQWAALCWVGWKGKEIDESMCLGVEWAMGQAGG
jgi:hypothetical protein